MKIVFLGDVRSTHVQKFVAFFAKEHQVCLISFKYPDDPRSPGGVALLKKAGVGAVFLMDDSDRLGAIFSVGEIVECLSPDLVHCHFLTNYGFLGACSGFHPLTMSAMGDDILLHPKRLFYGLLVRYALRKADAVTCDGLNSILGLRGLGVPKEKIRLIYPGVDMDNFIPTKRVEREYPSVICPRGFEDVYDPETLLQTILLVHRSVPEAIFDILRASGPAAERFKSRIKEAGIDYLVRFREQIDNDKLPEYFASADVCLNTSLSDGGIPTSTIEAMACGTPVVSTDAGDARVWIDDGENGYVVEKGDAEGLADRVVKILREKDGGMRVMSRGRVAWCWDYKEEMGKASDLFKELVDT